MQYYRNKFKGLLNKFGYNLFYTAEFFDRYIIIKPNVLRLNFENQCLIVCHYFKFFPSLHVRVLIYVCTYMCVCVNYGE